MKRKEFINTNFVYPRNQNRLKIRIKIILITD